MSKKVRKPLEGNCPGCGARVYVDANGKILPHVSKVGLVNGKRRQCLSGGKPMPR